MDKVKNKNILIIGFGVTGKGVLEWCYSYSKTVTVFSDSLFLKNDSVYQKYKDRCRFVEGNTSLIDMKSIDLVIISPSVSKKHILYKKASKYNIPIKLDVTLFLEIWNKRGVVIGITGSNGKSTTATLLHHTLRSSGLRSVLVGNIGLSPLSVLDTLKDNTYVVLELSCSQLGHFESNHGVDIAIITNITQNHLDMYGGSMEKYAAVKRKIISPKTHVIYSNDDKGNKKYLVPHIRSRHSTPVSLQKKIERGIFCDKRNIFQVKGRVLMMDTISNRKLPGDHNIYNIMCVLAVLNNRRILKEVDIQVVREFVGLEHRTEYVTSIAGVQYINDSKSTSPDATNKAFAMCAKNIKKTILIAGGSDKGISYSDWRLDLSKSIRHIILLPGLGTCNIRKVFESDPTITIYEVDSMKEAVAQAYVVSQPGDVVLLSPGTSSKGTFTSFEDRGRKFKREVYSLQKYNEKIYALDV